MNRNKELNLTHSKSKVKWWPMLAIYCIVLAFPACNKEIDSDGVVEYPSLKVVNQNNDDRAITSVSLVGYDFKSLNITIGGSQTFVLDKGMPGGYSDININVSYVFPSGSLSTKVNFNKGATTIITLKGCVRAEGCTGLYLE